MHVDRSAAAAWVGGSALDQGVAEVVDLVVVVDEQRVVGVPTAPMMAGRLQGDLSGANLTGADSSYADIAGTNFREGGHWANPVKGNPGRQ